MDDSFEKAYIDFLDEEAYDETAAHLFPIIRTAFKAGWTAAGGKAPGTAPHAPDKP